MSAASSTVMSKTTQLWMLMAIALYCASASADVEVTYDETVNFAYLRTFAWTEGTPPEDASLEKRIEAAIQRELIVKGFRKDTEDPDFVIAIHFEGDTVIIEMRDIDSDEIFWRGVGSGAIPQKEKKLERKINQAAAKMFRKFPPQSK